MIFSRQSVGKKGRADGRRGGSTVFGAMPKGCMLLTGETRQCTERSGEE